MKIMSSSPPDPAQNPRWTRHLSTLLLAWVLAAAWGSVVQTQWNLQALVGVGVDIPAAARARQTFQDLLGPAKAMQTQYLPQIREKAATLDAGQIMQMIKR